MCTRIIKILLLAGLLDAPVFAASPESVAMMQTKYDAARVVYDVSSDTLEKLNNVLDRISMLQNIYESDPFDASIIVVIHDAAIPYFVKGNNQKFHELVKRAQSLTMGDVIKFRMCSASARMQGFKQEDIQDFIVMVPMADAEIIKLQREEYALMH